MAKGRIWTYLKHLLASDHVGHDAPLQGGSARGDRVVQIGVQLVEARSPRARQLVAEGNDFHRVLSEKKTRGGGLFRGNFFFLSFFPFLSKRFILRTYLPSPTRVKVLEVVDVDFFDFPGVQIGVTFWLNPGVLQAIVDGGAFSGDREE